MAEKPKTMAEAQANLYRAWQDFIAAFVEAIHPVIKQAEDWQKKGWLDKDFNATPKLKRLMKERGAKK